DIDFLVKNRKSNIYHYFEIKHKNNHDSGKNPEILRQFLTAISYIAIKWSITNPNQLIAHLVFFNDRRTTYFDKFLPTSNASVSTRTGDCILSGSDMLELLFPNEGQLIHQAIINGLREVSLWVRGQLNSLQLKIDELMEENQIETTGI